MGQDKNVLGKERAHRGTGQDHTAGAAKLALDTAASQGGRRPPTDARQAVEARIDRLKSLATEEGIEISAASERDLCAFLDSVAPSRSPYIALLGNGNFRAVRKNDGTRTGGLAVPRRQRSAIRAVRPETAETLHGTRGWSGRSDAHQALDRVIRPIAFDGRVEGRRFPNVDPEVNWPATRRKCVFNSPAACATV